MYIGHDTKLGGTSRGSNFSMSGGAITGNQSVDPPNPPTTGAIVLATEYSRASFDHVVIQNNTGGSFLRGESLQDIEPASISNCLITDNTFSLPLVEVAGGGSLVMSGTTITNNALSNAVVLATANDLELGTSIVWQPGRQTAQVGGTKDIADVVASETASLGDPVRVVKRRPRRARCRCTTVTMSGCSAVLSATHGRIRVRSPHRPRSRLPFGDDAIAVGGVQWVSHHSGISHWSGSYPRISVARSLTYV